MPLSQELTLTLSQAAVRQPFFSSYLYARMAFEERAPYCATDGETIYLDGWWRALPPAQRLYVLAHEVYHGIFDHMRETRSYAARGVGPYGMPLDLQLLNAAEDLCINSMLTADKIGERPREVLFDETVKPTDSVPDVYKRLVQDADFRNRNAPKQGQPGQQGGNRAPSSDGSQPQPQGMPDQQGSQAGHDAHLAPPDKGASVDDSPGDPCGRVSHDDAIRAAVRAAQEAGALPGHLARVLDIDLDPEPKIDWVSELLEFLETSPARQYITTARLSRRRLVLPPHLPFPTMAGHHLQSAVVAIDTSGSIPQEVLRTFLVEVAGMMEALNPEELLLVWWDTKANAVEVEDLYDLETAEPLGGGGTDYGCVPREIKRRGLHPDVVICLTDGLARVPDESAVPWPHVTLSTNRPWPWGKNIPLQV